MPSAAPINEFNAAIKSSGVWDQWMQANGIDTTPGRPVRLSDTQRRAFQQYLKTQGAQFPKGVEIDSSGNMNEDEGFTKELKKWGPLAAGIAVSLFGIPGTPIAGLLSGGGGAAAGAKGALGFTGNAAKDTALIQGGTRLAATGAGFGSTALRYGLQYGLPTAAGLIGTKMQTNAQREGDREMADYYRRALEAEIEERNYRRGWDEEGRRYDREFGEEGRRYDRYRDEYGRLSDEELLRYTRTKDDYDRLSDEDKLRYDRARNDYSRLSDEERLWYDRAQGIRDKNYGYQQYGNFVETLEPYRIAGVSATDRLSRLIGGPVAPSTGSYLNLARTARDSVQPVPTVPNRPTWDYTPNRPTWNYTPNRPTWNYDDRRQESDGTSENSPTSTTMPVDRPSTDRVILMRAPNGDTREVDPALADFYAQRGARRIG